MLGPDASEVLRVGAVELRPDEYTAMLAGRVLTLSQRELELLEVFMRNHGRILSRERLYRAVWRREPTAGDRSVDVYVHKLRSKLEAAMPGWTFVHTHFRFGYRFSPEAVAPATGRSQTDNKTSPGA